MRKIRLGKSINKKLENQGFVSVGTFDEIDELLQYLQERKAKDTLDYSNEVYIAPRWLITGLNVVNDKGLIMYFRTGSRRK